jgi:hypothetical protein
MQAEELQAEEASRVLSNRDKENMRFIFSILSGNREILTSASAERGQTAEDRGQPAEERGQAPDNDRAQLAFVAGNFYDAFKVSALVAFAQSSRKGGGEAGSGKGTAAEDEPRREILCTGGR